VLWVQGGPPGDRGSGGGAAAAAAQSLCTASGGKARVMRVRETSVWGALGSGAGVTKCLLPAALIARDGSAVVCAGGLSLALEASARGVPVVIVASAARLSPHATAAAALCAATGRKSLEGALEALQAPPTGVLDLEDAAAVGASGALALASAATQQGQEAGGGVPSVTIVNALYDVLEARLLSLVVTNAGVAAPGNVWRLCTEAYGSSS